MTNTAEHDRLEPSAFSVRTFPVAGWGNLSAQAVKDFDADQESGEVKAAMDGNTITFQNHNTAAYSIWYKVQVESCAADLRGKRRVIEFDPRIDNRGSG